MFHNAGIKDDSLDLTAIIITDIFKQNKIL